MLATILWGGNAIAGRWFVGHLSPAMLNLFRWMIAAAVLMPFPGTLDSYSGAAWCAPTRTDECIHIHMRADPAYTINDGDNRVASRGVGLCGFFSDNNDNNNDYTQA